MSRRPRIAFATADPWPELVEDDLLAARLLVERGMDVEPAIWDGDVDWSRFDAVVIRSCWDYHVKGEAFRRWVESMGERALFNPATTVVWNMHKRYLLDLAREGVPTVETVIVARGDALDLPGLMRERGWDACVVKPAISLTSYRTECIARDEAARGQEHLDALVRDGDALVQPYRPEIEAGELSFVFLDGAFSHCVRKTPAEGDFRSQEEFGGTRSVVRPSAAMIARAEVALRGRCAGLLYARVDVVEAGDELILMELEAIDPTLFLALDEAAPARFADAIERRVRAAR